MFSVATDEAGYLLHLTDWSEELAVQLAQAENVELTPLSWKIIAYVRQFYMEQQDIPKMRILLAKLREDPQYRALSSANIHQLFPQSPALQISKIAGLPMPKKCL